MKKESIEAAKKSLAIERDALSQLIDYFNEEAFTGAVDILAKARLIVTSGCGNSGIAAKKFAHTLCCIEKSAMFLPTGEAVHGGTGALKKGDACVLLSRGGKTSELLPITAICKEKGVNLITVTENADSPLAKLSDAVLEIKIEREADKYDMMATSSIIVPIALFDALICALIEETGFKREYFRLIHPGGAVGEMLKEESKV